MYIKTPSAIWRVLLAHIVCLAFSRAWAKTGNRIAARIAMMAITTSNSISVKPFVGCCDERVRETGTIDCLLQVVWKGPCRQGQGWRGVGRTRQSAVRGGTFLKTADDSMRGLSLCYLNAGV